MKKIIYLFTFIVSAVACNNGGQNNSESLSTDLVKDTGKKPVISFDKTEHDFGQITEGEVVSHTFYFTNTGDADLIIGGPPITSCGCTATEYTKEPVKPGKKGNIVVKYNSAHKSGVETKEVTVMANTTPPSTVLTIKADTKATRPLHNN